MRFLALIITVFLSHCASQKSADLTNVNTQTEHSGSYIAAYCIAQKGRRVGNGECWTLANEAFKAAGVKRPGNDLRVWGRRVYLHKEKVEPGDVLEFRSAHFSNGIITGPVHTAVVIKCENQNEFTIAEQNWGRKTVRFRVMNTANLTGGELIVYRPDRDRGRLTY